MKSKHIPRATIQRLAVYLQVLEAMSSEETEVVSSEALARACDVNPSQIRKDLAYFGEFGVRGVGYYVSKLIQSIKVSLGTDRIWRTALIGVGNLGRSLLRYQGFPKRGFKIVAAFDCDPFKIGETISGLEVMCPRRMKENVKDMRIEIGIITTPTDRAQRAANYLVESDIRCILNFSATRIHVPDNVFVEYVDFFHHLYALTFKLNTGAMQQLEAFNRN
ncbi:MAG: redox-sensing transcriptional repressor Rex [Desulfovibrionales bacterium]|nr:MAG: redox-sensing transcriptional repressor Rex [Desulfovibrionales bacterium]